MSNDVLSLNKHKENVYSFKITAEGISTSELTVYFYINTPDMRLLFKCTRSENDEYICTIPILSFIDQTAYNCGLLVQTNDGYYFEPFKGSINVTSGVTVTGQPGHNITKAIKAAVDSEPSQKPKSNAFNVDNILSKMDKLEDKVEKQEDKIKQQEKKIEAPVKETTIHNKKDQTISSILTELGIKVNKKRVLVEGARIPSSIKSKLK